jgi:hypothetical protein
VGDKRTGMGRLASVLGPDYTGVWVDSKQHGHGAMAFKDGTAYTGDFFSGKRQGNGKFVSVTMEGGETMERTLFDGQWSADSPQHMVESSQAL